MTARRFPIIPFLAILVVGIFCPSVLMAAERLNVLFIATDDLTNDLGCYNSAYTNVRLRFTSKPNRLYRFEHSTNLTSGWTNSPLGTFAPAAGTFTLSDSFFFAAGPRRFFRVVALRPLQP